ncbi:hypothetical protein Csa_010075 [Cucumis sativus]|nr:hypothetical protein Csa_010075 [Cucumis sativus]
MGDELKLLIRTSSPYILRIVWALKLKGLEYDTVYDDQDLNGNNNPIHKNVPVLLLHDGKPIVEPLIILEYIDEIWSQNPLLSQDPYKKALLPSIKKAFTSNQDKEEGREEALKNWKHLEEELKEKRFFGGEGIGLVDIVVGWIAYSLNVMEEMIGHDGPQLMITPERTWSSPFPLRIVWALKLKGIEYETVYEDLANKSPLLLEYNPIHKKVPVLVHGGKPIAESLVILEYIEETWKQNPLLPQDPYQRAVARFWAKFGDDKVLESIKKVFMNQGKVREEGVEEAMENLKHLEEELKGKRFFGGEAIGFVDIAVGWLANIVSVMEEVVGLELITEERFPLLSKWTKEFAAAPIINENWPPRDKLITKYQALYQTYMTKQE